MSFYENALKRLREIYAFCEKSNRLDFCVSRSDYMNFTTEERNSMTTDFSIMEEEGWITTYAPCSGTPYSYKLTAEGIRVAEGRTLTSIEEYTKLVKAKEPNETTQKEILSALKLVLEKMDKNEPLEPGILGQINTQIQSASWLSGPIASTILQYFSR